MKQRLLGVATLFVLLLAVVVILVLGHFAVIEIGQEVVTLRTRNAEGSLHSTRLWIVDDGGVSWLHSGGPAWLKRFEGSPIVEVERHGQRLQFRAEAMPGPHPRIDRLLREKYGLTDRWVRFLGPDNDQTVAVRLEPLPH